MPTLLRSIGVRLIPVLAIATALASALFVVRPDRMLVEHVRFVGADQASTAELRHLADLVNGTRIWEVDRQQVARGVQRHPWVREAAVRRVFPDTVEITVHEHEPVALLHYGRLYYVASDGTIFLPARADDLDYPSITGLTDDLQRRHPDLPRAVVSQVLELLSQLDQRGLVPSDRVDEIHFSATHGFTVRTGASRVLFALSGLDHQLDRLEQLLASGTVDLDRALHVDLGPRTVAIVRPLERPGAG